jgi:hypothetical protein
MLGFSPCVALFSVVFNSAAAEAGIGMGICGTTKQAAEKGGLLGKRPELQPSGAKARRLVLFGLRHD